MEYFFSDINEAFAVIWHRMWDDHGIVVSDSRNGPVRRLIFPVTTIFQYPRRRVLMHKARDCNPFFHLFESIWMLAGRNEVDWLAMFNKRMMDYSDDGLTLVSAYGHRWIGILPNIIEMLRKDPDTRRAFIPLFWTGDVLRTGKDTPCNTGIAFYVRKGLLDMTVFNRSNDMVYGAYGANVVHFSFLQEYVAAALGIGVGYYAQISSNFHLYTEFDITKRLIGKVDLAPNNPYETGGIGPAETRILTESAEIDDWQVDAAYFIDTYTRASSMSQHHWRTPFFARIAAPMYNTWRAFVRQKDESEAANHLLTVEAADWRLSARQWIENRLEARRAKEANR